MSRWRCADVVSPCAYCTRRPAGRGGGEGCTGRAGYLRRCMGLELTLTLEVDVR